MLNYREKCFKTGVHNGLKLSTIIWLAIGWGVLFLIF